MTEITRRRLATAVGAAALASGAGCLERAQAVLEREQKSGIALTISTLPADDDPRCTEIAQRLAEQLRRVGVDASVRLRPPEELLRDVLVNQDFDLYVAQYPGAEDPDFLRPLLHSRFGELSGWQNPFGFADPSVDDLLERQCRVRGDSRKEVLYDLQRSVARFQPFTVIAFPDVVRAIRTDRLVVGPSTGFSSPLEYLSLSLAGGGDPPDEIRLTRTDARITQNLNPLAVEFRTDGRLMGLLYGSLGRRVDGFVRPWLAERWRWVDAEAPGPVAEVRLRSGLAWHDGRPITSEDVAFTYRFVQDTSLGRLDAPVPAARYHGRISLLRSVEAVDRRTLRLSFESCQRPVARRAFTVPVLPRHVWESLAGPATVAGIEVAPNTTEALVWENAEPVGSGPFRVSRVIPETELVLERVDEHFLYSDGPPWFDGGPDYDRLVVRIVPSAAAAVALVEAGEADATDTPVGPENVPRIGRADRVGLEVARSRAFYHLGFNVRRPPLVNYRFRRVVASLLNKSRLVDRVFAGYATPVASPLAGTNVLPPDLEWSGSDPALPYPGSDGSLDEARVRAAFEDAGYSFGASGDLLERT